MQSRKQYAYWITNFLKPTIFDKLYGALFDWFHARSNWRQLWSKKFKKQRFILKFPLLTILSKVHGDDNFNANPGNTSRNSFRLKITSFLATPKKFKFKHQKFIWFVFKLCMIYNVLTDLFYSIFHHLCSIKKAIRWK